jgi:hypothetical protein
MAASADGSTSAAATTLRHKGYAWQATDRVEKEEQTSISTQTKKRALRSSKNEARANSA